MDQVRDDGMFWKRNRDTMTPHYVDEEALPDQNIDHGGTKEIKTLRNTTSKTINYKVIDKETKKRVIFWSHVAVCCLAIGLCVASITVPKLQRASLKGLRMWQWCLLASALLAGPLLSKAIVNFILLFIERDFSVRENVIYYVVGLGETATVVLWFGMILVAWLWVVEEPSYLGLPQQDIGQIKKTYATTFHIITVTLITFILGSFLWVLKDIVIMKAKSSFHIRRFFDRIIKALLHQYVIDRLSKKSYRPPNNGMNSMNVSVSRVIQQRKERRLVEMSCFQGASQENLILENTDTDVAADGDPTKDSIRKVGLCTKEKTVVNLSCFDDVNRDNVSCWGMKILIEWIIENPSLSYYKDYDPYSQDNVYETIEDNTTANQAAEAIFHRLVDRDQTQCSHIGRGELSRCFTQDKIAQVESTLFEGTPSEHFEIDLFRKWMVNVSKNRKALARALEANKTLFKMFNRFVNVLLVFLIFALWLIMLRVETRKVIFLIGSALVGSAFIFGDTSRKLLDNILFVFVVHPFDIGDCCIIDNTPVIIEEINFLTTTVSTFENEMKHYPNAVLSGQSISNYTRSPQMGDAVTLYINIETPDYKIVTFKNDIKSYIKSKPQYWSGEHYWVMELENINNVTAIKMTLNIKHTINFHELIERQLRKSELVLEIKKVLHDLALTSEGNTANDVKQEQDIVKISA